MRKLEIVFGATLATVLLSSCAAGLADAAIGARIATGARVAAGAELAGARMLAGDAIAGRTFAGFSVGSRVVGTEGAAGRLFVSEELASSGAFRAALDQIAGRTGMRLFRDPRGFLSVGSSPVAVVDGGYVTIGANSSLGPRVVGLIRDGKIWQVNAARQQVRALGSVRGVVNRPTVNVRAGPSTSADEIATLRPGTLVDVVRMQDGWFEVTFSNGLRSGWIDASLIGLAVTAASAQAAVAGESTGVPSSVETNGCFVDELTFNDSTGAFSNTRTQSQTFEYVSFTALGVKASRDGRLRVVLEVTAHSNDGRGAGVAFRVPRRNGPLGYWELPSLTDERGGRRHLQPSSMIGLDGRSSSDWAIVRDGAAVRLNLDFPADQFSCLSVYALDVDLTLVWRDTAKVQQARPISLSLQGLRP